MTGPDRTRQMHASVYAQEVHLDPQKCPTWHDGCHCTVQGLLRTCEQLKAENERLKKRNAKQKKMLDKLGVV